jgi:hypothetical protein
MDGNSLPNRCAPHGLNQTIDWVWQCNGLPKPMYNCPHRQIICSNAIAIDITSFINYEPCPESSRSDARNPRRPTPDGRILSGCRSQCMQSSASLCGFNKFNYSSQREGLARVQYEIITQSLNSISSFIKYCLEANTNCVHAYVRVYMCIA